MSGGEPETGRSKGGNLERVKQLSMHSIGMEMVLSTCSICVCERAMAMALAVAKQIGSLRSEMLMNIFRGSREQQSPSDAQVRCGPRSPSRLSK